MANLSKPEPVAVISKSAPSRELTLENGDVVVEKLPPTRYVAKMVTPSGNVISVPTSTGRALPTHDVDNRYWVTKEREKLSHGFIYYGRCPSGECSDASDEHACKHVEAEIAKRSGRQTDHNKAFHDQFKSSPERFYDAEMKRIGRSPKRGRSSE